jgi:hypothetical protein
MMAAISVEMSGQMFSCAPSLYKSLHRSEPVQDLVRAEDRDKMEIQRQHERIGESSQSS